MEIVKNCKQESTGAWPLVLADNSSGLDALAGELPPVR
jgi:hypothetical protein